LSGFSGLHLKVLSIRNPEIKTVIRSVSKLWQPLKLSG